MKEINEQTIPQIFALIEPEEANKQYKISKYVWYEFADFHYDEDEDDQDTCIYTGDLHVTSVKPSPKRDWNRYNLIVDGNLTVDGTFEWSEGGNGSFVFITGNLKAKNVMLSGNPVIVVLGDLVVEDWIVGVEGEDGGQLIVDGNWTAKYVFNVFDFMLGAVPGAINIGDEIEMPEADYFFRSTAKDILLPEFWDDEDEYVDIDNLWKGIMEGRQILK